MTTILIDKNVMVSVRNGVKLATDVYRLEGASPTPVLVVRTPYNKDRMVAGGDIFDILRTVQAGYTAVTQDVRGALCLRGDVPPARSRDRRRPGCLCLGSRSALVKRGGQYLRRLLPGLHPVAPGP